MKKILALTVGVFIIVTALAKAADEYYTESEMVFRPGAWHISPLCQEERDKLFPGCCSLLSINIKTYGDIDRDLGKYKKFGFDLSSKENPLLEKELFQMLGKALIERGLVRSDESPDFLISMKFFVGKREEYIPPQTISTSQTEWVWSSGMIGFTPTGQYTAVPVISTEIVPGQTKVTFYRNIRLYFLDMAELKKGINPEPPLVWIGEVESEGASSDIRTVAPLMLGELAWEFPKPSNRGVTRSILEIRHGGIGVAVSPKDWTLITRVFSGSPAHAAGLVPGDKIISINGKQAKHGPRTFNFSGSGPYKRNDPYYLYILKNKGDQEIEIKSAANDAKPRTVRLTPVYTTRYLYFTPDKEGESSEIGYLEPVPWPLPGSTPILP